MPDYQKAKIYKLVGYGLTYYGATIQSLCERKSGHKRNINKCMSKELFKLGDDIDIVLVENYPCNNKEELHQRERYYIENNECINKQIPTRTKKEYCETNKENKKEYDKEYRENNKDKIKQYREDNKEMIKLLKKENYEQNKEIINNKRKEKIICECGGKYTLNHKSTHLKTEKHKKFNSKK